ncbi:hypothetical protein [Aliiroseovarius sp. F47248L]|uniref:hypothetical protein n=1 Tax=Aliiroseovarius sp. F47248L TaxID=2926420 RepID=UPI001FF455DC|nr:hypothetical protein [Aliiroseovarius sp. F47248L]MCK0139922.1 hypothetical protein [Aliiroseovarius sp. F47248L]
MTTTSISRLSRPLLITTLALSMLALVLVGAGYSGTKSSKPVSRVEQRAAGINNFTVDELLNTPPSDPCQFFGGENAMVEWFIEMDLENKLIPMRVPKIYLEDKPDHEEGVHHTAQLFRIILDNFLPVTRSQTSAIHRAQPDNAHARQYGRLLVGDYIELREIISLMISMMGGRFDERRPMEEFPVTPGPYGLTKVLPPAGNLERNVYFRTGSDGNPVTAIECHIKNEVSRYPTCNMRFRASEVDVNVGFHVPYLPRWAAIKQDVERFLSCATDFEQER